MATQTHETRIMGQSMAPRRVLASEARGQLEKDTLTAMIAGLTADKFLLGDLLDICPADCFVTPFARPIAEALDILRKSGASQDIVTLAVQMRERWALDSTRWIQPDLVWFSEAAGSPWGLRSFAETFARKLVNEHRRAALHASLLQVAAEADVYGVDVCEVAERARKVADTAFEGQTTANGMGDIMARIREKLDSPQALRRIETPWGNLNRVLRGGLLPGELVVLAARPGLGKTAMASNLALDVAERGMGVLFVSCEMSEESLACRMISQVGRIDGRFFREGLAATGQIRASIDMAMEHIGALPMSIVERSTVPMCPREVRRLARGVGNLGLVVVDYLQLLHPDERNTSREREVAEMSRSFKQMAMDLQVPVLLLSQLNRSSEEGQREPRVSDLRESGAIEQDADIILLLHTRSIDRSQATPQVKCIVGKSRSTGTGAAWLRFRKEFSLFEEGTPWNEPAGAAVTNDL